MKKTLYLNVFKTITSSLGRFLSMSALLCLGAFALVGLRVTGPNIEQTVFELTQQEHSADLFVMSSMGLAASDQQTLQDFQKEYPTQLELSYFQDVTIEKTPLAIRVLSLPEQVSKPTLLRGQFPKQANEIVLSEQLADDYTIGDTLTVTPPHQHQLVHTSFTITGFVTSAEYLSTTSLGQTNMGNGTLTGLAYTVTDNFNAPVWTLARLRFLDDKMPYSADYNQIIWNAKETLLPLLNSNGNKRFDDMKHAITTQLEQANQALALLNAQREQLFIGPQREALNRQIDSLTQQIAQAQQQLHTLQKPTYTIYDRSTMLGSDGYDTLSATAKGIMSVSLVFPIVLYGVAILVAVTTMTRLVNEERLNAGILKALGYTTRDIMKKFIIYGACAGIIGTITGAMAGLYGLPIIIGQTLLANTVLPPIHLSFDWPLLLLTLVITLTCSILPAIIVVLTELQHPASTLLVAKAPSTKTRRILLERFPFIWSKLSFSQKVTARNMFRYKQRFLMTIFGVAGSTALLFSGLGILSSLNGIVTRQYETLLQYDALMMTHATLSATQRQNIEHTLASDRINGKLPIYTHLFSHNKSDTQQTFRIMAMASDQPFDPFIQLNDANTKKRLTLSDSGVIINEKLATLLQLKPGDTLTLHQDDKTYSFHIDGIMEMYAGHYLVMNKQQYEHVFNQPYTTNSYLLDYKDTNLSNTLLQLDGVSTILQNDTTMARIQQMVRSLTLVMGILVGVSVLLSIVILYNLTTINVMERLRELSTIKVLGFYPHEVTLYIYRETTVLSLIGILIGIGSGIPLHRLLIDVTATDMMMFHPDVDIWVYIVPVFLISMTIASLGWHVHRYLKHINMLDALKSVD